MGDARRLSDIAKEFQTPGLKGPTQSVPGLGKRFGDGSNVKTGETRTKEDVPQPQNNKVANDNPKTDTNKDGAKSSNTTPQIYKQQKSSERLVPRASAALTANTANGLRKDSMATSKTRQSGKNHEPQETRYLRELGNEVWRHLGPDDWETAHGLHKAANRIAEASLAKRYHQESGFLPTDDEG
jgi:hypothetical protein